MLEDKPRKAKILLQPTAAFQHERMELKPGQVKESTRAWRPGAVQRRWSLSPRKQFVSKFKNEGSAAGFPSQLHSCHWGTSISLCKAGDIDSTHLIRLS